MFLTVHGTVGAIIGLQTGNPLLAFLFGLISHYIFDMIPHGDEKMIADHQNVSPQEIKKIAQIGSIDGLTMLFLLGGLLYSGRLPLDLAVLFGVAGGILPDFLNAFYQLLKFKWLKFHYDFHLWLHGVLKKFAVSFKTGLAIQAAILAVLLWRVV